MAIALVISYTRPKRTLVATLNPTSMWSGMTISWDARGLRCGAKAIVSARDVL